MIERYAETRLPTIHGEFRCVVFRELKTGAEHVAMVVGDPKNSASEQIFCRVHSECLTSEVLGSVKCDCAQQLDRALERIQEAGEGVVLYLRQEGRGIGLGNKIRAYALQEEGHDTVDANRLLGLPDDARNYEIAALMLKDLGVSHVELMTNNPLKVDGLKAHGIKVERVEHQVEAPSDAAADYVKTKGARMGHLVEFPRKFRVS